MEDEDLLFVENSSLVEVVSLLCKWNFPEDIAQRFLDLEIDETDLEHLSENVISSIFQNDLKHQIKFESRLSEWRKHRNSKCKCAEDLSAGSSNKFKAEDVFTESLPFVLSKTRKGKTILAGYHTSEKLSDADRDMLITCLSEYYLEKDVNLGRKDFKFLAESIVQTFPTETEETYFLAGSKGSEPSGCLFHKFRNLRRSYIKRGILTKIDRSAKKAFTEDKNKEEVPTESLTSHDDENALISDKNWLKQNFEPWELVETKWKNTIKLRSPNGKKFCFSLAELKDEWPILATSLAHKLINFDFEELYAECKPVVSWEKISQYVISHVKISEEEYNPTNPASKDVVCLLNLHKVFKPSLLTTSTHEKRKKHKFTIIDSQKSQIEFCSSLNNLETIIAEKRKEGRVQPFIIVQGSKFDPQQYHTYFDNNYVTFDNILKALDFCIKGYFLYDLSYPIQSEKVWYFLQESLFGIKSAKSIPMIHKVLNEIK